MSIARNDTLSAVGRATHDVGLSALLGGNLFAQIAMHPALAKVSDERERGAVTNAAWRRYGTVNSLGLAAIIANWAAARAIETRPRDLTSRERSLARAKDVAVAAVAVMGVATAIEGIRFNAEAPGGAVPIADGNRPSDSTPPSAARRKKAATALARGSILAEVALWGINAGIAQTAHRRPAKRRVLKRVW